MASKYEIQPSCQIAHDVLQKLYLEEFGYRNYGTFVEVGAWDGVQFSNTWGLARAGWAEFRRQLAYKTVWYGSRLVVAPKFYPSSKTCSRCGHVKAELSLAERTYTCSECGFEVDRDLNAALNLEKLACASVESTGSSPGSNACGDDARPSRPRRQSSVKQESAVVVCNG